jgi:hypothetical protein
MGKLTGTTPRELLKIRDFSLKISRYPSEGR